MAGWVKLHRSLLEWEWYDDANTSRLFIHCLLKANHKDKSWRGVEIRRGQFLTSLDSLAKETGLSVSKLRTAISKLEKTIELASKSHAGGGLVTVVGYDSYQGEDKENDKGLASESQGVSKRVATTKNVKNENNDKNDKKQTSSSDDSRVPYQDFVDLFNASLGNQLAMVKALSDPRKKAIKRLWTDQPNPQWWADFFGFIGKSDFLMGRAGDFQASFDWIVKPANFLKIVEGNYENRTGTGGSNAKSTPLTRAIEQGQRLTELNGGGHGAGAQDVGAAWCSGGE